MGRVNEAGWAASAALLSTISAYLVARWQRPKIEAETRSEYAGAAERLSMISLQLVEPLDARINEMENEMVALRAEIVEMRSEIIRLEGGVNVLRGQIFQLGATPIWPPKTD